MLALVILVLVMHPGIGDTSISDSSVSDTSVSNASISDASIGDTLVMGIGRKSLEFKMYARTQGSGSNAVG
ncbi:hypothetical protein EV426DRAFT_711792 [Tirmania nivea]|nr:hypothetical protein EV426DRAFT_711792 [Tirmania nivea]